MSNKRRKVGKKPEDSILPFAEPLDEFRSRFIDSIGFRAGDWKKLCKESKVGKISQLKWGKLSNEEISKVIAKNETEELRFNFESLIFDKVDENENVTQRICTIISDYYESSDFTRKRLISLIDKFFSSQLSKTKEFAEMRRNEEELVMSSSKQLTHIYLSGVRFPIEIVHIIMEYFPSNYEDAIYNLACVNEKWFRIVLETWKKVEISDNYLKIPKLVMKNVKNVEFVKSDSDEENLVDLSYCFDQFTKTKIHGLDFSDLYLCQSSKRVFKPLKDQFLIRLDEFRNLRSLKLPRRPFSLGKGGPSPRKRFITNFIRLGSIPRLVELDCDLTDFRKLENLKNVLPQLSTLGIGIREVWYLDPIFKNILSSQPLGNLKDLRITLFKKLKFLPRVNCKKLNQIVSKFVSSTNLPNLMKFSLVNDLEESTSDQGQEHEELKIDLSCVTEKLSKVFIGGKGRVDIISGLPNTKLEEILFESNQKITTYFQFWNNWNGHERNLDPSEKIKKIVKLINPESETVERSPNFEVENFYVDVNFPFSNPISYNEAGSGRYYQENRYFTVSTNWDLVKMIEKAIYHPIGYTRLPLRTKKLLYTFYVDSEYVLDVSIEETEDRKKKTVTIQIFSDFFLGEDEEVEDNYYLHNTAYDYGWKYEGDPDDFKKPKKKLSDVLEEKKERHYLNLLCKLMGPVRYLLLGDADERKVDGEKEWQGSTKSDFEKGFRGSKFVLKSQCDEDENLEEMSLSDLVVERNEFSDDDDDEDFSFVYIFEC